MAKSNKVMGLLGRGVEKQFFVVPIHMYSTYSPRAKNDSNIFVSFSLHLYLIQQPSLSSTIELSIPLKPYFKIQEIIVYQLWRGRGRFKFGPGHHKTQMQTRVMYNVYLPNYVIYLYRLGLTVKLITVQ